MNNYKTRGTVIQIEKIEKCIYTLVYIYIQIWTLIIFKV